MRLYFLDQILLAILKILWLPKEDWWKKEGWCISYFFPPISLGLGIGQIEILPGKTPNDNITVLHYIAPQPPKNDEEIARSKYGIFEMSLMIFGYRNSKRT